jgi:hypothetical protein
MKEYIAKQQQSKQQTERTSIVGIFTVDFVLASL